MGGYLKKIKVPEKQINDMGRIVTYTLCDHCFEKYNILDACNNTTIIITDRYRGIVCYGGDLSVINLNRTGCECEMGG